MARTVRTVRDITAKALDADAELTAGKRYLVSTEHATARSVFIATLEAVEERFNHAPGDVWRRVTRWDNGVTLTEDTRGLVRFQEL